MKLPPQASALVLRSIIGLIGSLVLSFLAATNAWAHKPSDAYLYLDVHAQQLQGRWDIALRDLDFALDLDANHDGKLSWGEVRTRLDAIDAYALATLNIRSRSSGAGSAPASCKLGPESHALERHSDGVYLVIDFTAPCDLMQGMTLQYQLFEDIDPTHRGVARVTFGAAAPMPMVFDPARGAVQVLPNGMTNASTLVPGEARAANGAPAGALQSNGAVPSIERGGFLREGIHHILVGYDHILFLLCLVLPAVLIVRKNPHRLAGEHPHIEFPRNTKRWQRWRPALSLRAALWPLAGTITAFTIAHSITLGLASARIVHLSPRFIEPAIAVTIMLAALNNVWPLITRRIAVLTFFFGLIHGFGFAEVLRDLDLPAGDFAWALLQFNLGVEIGQLIIVGIAIAPLFLLRKKPWYPAIVLRGGSWFALLMAAIWFAERIFDFKVLPI